MLKAITHKHKEQAMRRYCDADKMVLVILNVVKDLSISTDFV